MAFILSSRGNFLGPNVAVMGSNTPTVASSSVVLTTASNNAAVGTDVFAVVASVPATLVTTTVTFTSTGAGNTWTTDVTKLDAGFNIVLAIGRCRVATALNTGSTITATFSNSQALQAICAFNEKGTQAFLPTIVLDAQNSNVGAGTATTTASVAVTQNPDWGVHAVGINNVPGAVNRTTPAPTGFSQIFAIGAAASGLTLMVDVYATVTDNNTALNPAATASGSLSEWAAGCAMYKRTRRSGAGRPMGASGMAPLIASNW